MVECDGGLRFNREGPSETSFAKCVRTPSVPWLLHRRECVCGERVRAAAAAAQEKRVEEYICVKNGNEARFQLAIKGNIRKWSTEGKKQAAENQHSSAAATQSSHCWCFSNGLAKMFFYLR